MSIQISTTSFSVHLTNESRHTCTDCSCSIKDSKRSACDEQECDDTASALETAGDRCEER